MNTEPARALPVCIAPSLERTAAAGLAGVDAHAAITRGIQTSLLHTYHCKGLESNQMTLKPIVLLSSTLALSAVALNAATEADKRLDEASKKALSDILDLMKPALRA